MLTYATVPGLPTNLRTRFSALAIARIEGEMPVLPGRQRGVSRIRSTNGHGYLSAAVHSWNYLDGIALGKPLVPEKTAKLPGDLMMSLERLNLTSPRYSRMARRAPRAAIRL